MSDAFSPLLGDAVMTPVNATPMTIDELFREGRLRPAGVQRRFEWDEKLASGLLQDIERVFLRGFDDPPSDEHVDEEGPEVDRLGDDASYGTGEEAGTPLKLLSEEEEAWAPMNATNPKRGGEAYFIGSVVFGEFQHATFDIFDGYQRLTVLSLLLATLRELTTDVAEKDACHALVAYSSVGNELPRLATAGPDDTFVRIMLSRGMRPSQAAARSRQPIAKRLKNICRAFENHLEDWSEEQRCAFAVFLRRHVHVCVLTVLAPEVGRQIFASTNMFGKKLKPIDLLKGQLSDTAVTESEAQEIIRLWDEIGANAGENFNGVIRAVDVITRRTTQPEQWPQDLGSFIADSRKPAAAIAWLWRLKRYESLWRRMDWIFRTGGDPDNIVHREIARLRVFEWSDPADRDDDDAAPGALWRPIALLFLERSEDEEKRFGKKSRSTNAALFSRLHRRCMALVLANLSPGKQENIYVKAVNDWLAGRDPTIRERALTVRPHQRVKIDRTLRALPRDKNIYLPLLHWLEGSRWRAELPAQMSGASVEHVLSQNPARDDEDEAATAEVNEFNRLCYSLGNLAIIPKSMQEVVANRPPPEKRAVYETVAGRYWTLDDVLSHSTWGKNDILAREARLIDEVWKELGLKPPSALRSEPSPQGELDLAPG